MPDDTTSTDTATTQTADASDTAGTTGEKHYTEAEANARTEAAIKERFKNAPTAEELEELRAAKKERDDLKLAQMDEVERAKEEARIAREEAETAKGEAAKAKLDAIKASIGAELNIPASLRSRLAGTTEEEVRADAVAVAAELKIEPQRGPIGGGGRPAGATGKMSPDEAAKLTPAEYEKAVKDGKL